jgi:hypothetical protein
MSLSVCHFCGPNAHHKLGLRSPRIKTPSPWYRYPLMNSTIRIVAGLAIMTFAIQAATVQFSGLNLLVPDGDSSGLANQQTVNLGTGSPGSLLDVSVTLNLSGVGGAGFNGDLYAWLQHDTGFSVLLNRVGRDLGNPAGYSDNGLSIVLDDSAANDIHTYRAALGGPFPLASALGGAWRPDGRETDPDSVLAGDARTAVLDSFNGLIPIGTWTLFIADLSTGGEIRLDGWGLELTIEPVPDGPVPLAWPIAVILAWAQTRRSRDMGTLSPAR